MKLFMNTKSHFRPLAKAAFVMGWLVLSQIVSVMSLRRQERSKVDVTIIKIDALGDLVIHAALFKELQRFFAERAITYQFLIDKRYEQILSDLSLDSNFEFFDRRSTSKIFRSLLRLFNRSSQTVINLHHTRPNLIADSMAWSVKSDMVIATKGVAAFDLLFEMTGRATQAKFIAHNESHELDFSWRLSSIALQSDQLIRPDLREIETKKIPQDPKIVFVLGAGQTGRCWGWENYRLVIERMLTITSCRISVIGQVNGLGYPESLINNQRVTWAVNQLSLKQYFAVLSEADVVIANDSSATHIASYFGKRTVAIYGGGHYERFRPTHVNPSLLRVITSEKECFNCNWRCKYVDIKKRSPPCIADVLPSDVEDALLELLREDNDNHNCF